jgi:hypothetical protein
MRHQQQKAIETAKRKLRAWMNRNANNYEWAKHNLKHCPYLQLWSFVTSKGWDKPLTEYQHNMWLNWRMKMPTEQAIVYWVGIILIRAGGLALLLVVVAGVLGLAMNYFWRKMKLFVRKT